MLKNPKVCSSENMSFTVLLDKANKSARHKKSFFRNFWEKLPNGWKWLPGKGLSSATCDWPWHSLTLEKESSNKLRQIQEISLLKILYPSLEPGISNQPTVAPWYNFVRLPRFLFWTVHVSGWPVRSGIAVRLSQVRAEIIDRSIVQYRFSKKRNKSVQRKSWRIHSRWKSSSSQTYSQGCQDLLFHFLSW